MLGRVSIPVNLIGKEAGQAWAHQDNPLSKQHQI